MNRSTGLKHLTRVCAVSSLFVLALAPAAHGAGLPPGLGKLCGHVGGASWKFQGQTGTQYNVTGSSSEACSVAMKSVGGLTKQTPHAGVVGRNTLKGSAGFSCAGSGIPLAHAGFCGKGTAHFFWAPRKS